MRTFIRLAIDATAEELATEVVGPRVGYIVNSGAFRAMREVSELNGVVLLPGAPRAHVIPAASRGRWETFASLYATELAAAIESNPKAYAYGIDRVNMVAENMTNGYREGRANAGPVAQAVARALGIKPTLKAIRDYLNDR